MTQIDTRVTAHVLKVACAAEESFRKRKTRNGRPVRDSDSAVFSAGYLAFKRALKALSPDLLKDYLFAVSVVNRDIGTPVISAAKYGAIVRRSKHGLMQVNRGLRDSQDQRTNLREHRQILAYCIATELMDCGVRPTTKKVLERLKAYPEHAQTPVDTLRKDLATFRKWQVTGQ